MDNKPVVSSQNKIEEKSSLSVIASALNSALMDSKDKALCSINLEKYNDFITKTIPDRYIAYVNQKKSMVDAPESSSSKKLIDATYTILSEPVFMLCSLKELSSLLESILQEKTYSPDIADLSFPDALNQISLIMTGQEIITLGEKGWKVSNESAVRLAQIYDKAGSIKQIDPPKYSIVSKIRYLFFPSSFFRYSENKDLSSGKPLSTLVEESKSYDFINRLSSIVETKIKDFSECSKSELLDAINKGFDEQRATASEIMKGIDKSSISTKGIDSRFAELVQELKRNRSTPDDKFLQALAFAHPDVFEYKDGIFVVKDTKFFYRGKYYDKTYKGIYSTIKRLQVDKGLSCPDYMYLMKVVRSEDGKKYGISAIRRLRTNLSPLKPKSKTEK